jgi:hypothetical protein
MAKEKAIKVQLDRLAAVMRKIPPDRLRMALVKDTVIQIRVTAVDKAAMMRTAQACQLTLTEYLTRLHYLASERLPHS